MKPCFLDLWLKSPKVSRKTLKLRSTLLIFCFFIANFTILVAKCVMFEFKIQGPWLGEVLLPAVFDYEMGEWSPVFWPFFCFFIAIFTILFAKCVMFEFKIQGSWLGEVLLPAVFDYNLIGEWGPLFCQIFVFSLQIRFY